MAERTLDALEIQVLDFELYSGPFTSRRTAILAGRPGSFGHHRFEAKPIARVLEPQLETTPIDAAPSRHYVNGRGYLS